jgi:hypothetical protein
MARQVFRRWRKVFGNSQKEKVAEAGLGITEHTGRESTSRNGLRNVPPTTRYGRHADGG